MKKIINSFFILLTISFMAYAQEKQSNLTLVNPEEESRVTLVNASGYPIRFLPVFSGTEKLAGVMLFQKILFVSYLFIVIIII